jgi:hypothetical protein
VDMSLRIVVQMYNNVVADCMLQLLLLHQQSWHCPNTCLAIRFTVKEKKKRRRHNYIITIDDYLAYIYPNKGRQLPALYSGERVSFFLSFFFVSIKRTVIITQGTRHEMSNSGSERRKNKSLNSFILFYSCPSALSFLLRFFLSASVYRRRRDCV